MSDSNRNNPISKTRANVRGLLPPLVAIAGPTATGKTALAIELALLRNGEVINADSRCFYRGLDIGVAKPSLAERRGVPHHLLDIIEPHEEMSLALYRHVALEAIAEVTTHDRLPFLTGGTPLYMKAVLEGWQPSPVPPQPTLREALEREAAEHGIERLQSRLSAVDPVAAARTGPNLRRIIRALEVHAVTGSPMTAQERRDPPPYRFLEIGLTMPREALYRAIDERVHGQIEAGLVEEARRLLQSGLSPDAPVFTSLGYRQLIPYLSGECRLDEAIARIQFDTHRYVRHQETWLRRNPNLIRFDVTIPGWQRRIIDLLDRFLAGEDPAHE